MIYDVSIRLLLLRLYRLHLGLIRYQVLHSVRNSLISWQGSVSLGMWFY